MKMKLMKKRLSLFLCMVLVVAMALFTNGCNDNSDNGASNVRESKTQEADAQESDEQNTEEQDEATQDAETQDEEAQGAQAQDAVEEEAGESEKGAVETEIQVLGEGNTVFSFQVVDKDGKQTNYEIHTDKTIVGEALLELGLIEGEDSEYGLYVKTVNGVTADYDKDGVYWAFYVNDEYAQTGVDSTEITEGDSYTFKVE